ncbi:MAG: hypothetical protein ACLFP4_16335 [Spirochaetales bacterium]
MNRSISRNTFTQTSSVYPASEYSSELENLGMVRVQSYETGDGLGRSGISWQTMILRKPGQT